MDTNSDNLEEENHPTKELTPSNFKNLLIELEEIEDQEFKGQHINKSIEIIRNLAEFLIYGSKEQNSYFELFIERNIFGIFTRILEKD